MTNLLTTFTITATLVTNWTGVNSGQRELGYVSTNQHAVVVYRGKPTKTLVADDLSGIAVWREKDNTLYLTNGVGRGWMTMPGISVMPHWNFTNGTLEAR